MTVSCAMWLGSAGVLLLVGLLMGIHLTAIEDAVRVILVRDYPAETTVSRDRVAALVALVLLGGGVVLAVTIAAFSTGLFSGRGGARLALAVLVVPTAVHAQLASSVAPTVAAAALPIGVGLAVAAAVAMLLPGTYRWFAQARR